MLTRGWAAGLATDAASAGSEGVGGGFSPGGLHWLGIG
jgi:hypothetical protein